MIAIMEYRSNEREFNGAHWRENMSALVPTFSFSSRCSHHSQDECTSNGADDKWLTMRVEPASTRGAASARQGAGRMLLSLLFPALTSLICATHMYTVAEACVASGTGAYSLLVSYICSAKPWVPRTLARACCPGGGTRGAVSFLQLSPVRGRHLDGCNRAIRRGTPAVSKEA